MMNWTSIVALAIRNMNWFLCLLGVVSPRSTKAAAFADAVLELEIENDIRFNHIYRTYIIICY